MADNEQMSFEFIERNLSKVIRNYIGLENALTNQLSIIRHNLRKYMGKRKMIGLIKFFGATIFRL